MTITLFVSILIWFSAATSIVTEAIKKAFNNAGKKYSANIIALINAIVLGCSGTAGIYLVLNIPFTFTNIIFIALMAICVWIGSMVGYDKIIQLFKQLEDKRC